MNNLRISYRILLLILLPLVGLVFFASTNTIEKYRSWRDLSLTVSLMDVATSMGGVNHMLQVERGATAGYLQSKGARFADALPGYQKATDEKLSELKALYSKHGNLIPPHIRTKIDSALESASGLENIRAQASGMKISAPDAAKFYTNTISTILSTLPVIAEQSGDIDVTKQMAGYIAFLNMKERAGQERALMVPVFTADRIEPAQYRTFLGHIAAQQAYLSTFKGYASDKARGLYKTKESGEAFAKVNDMREAVFGKDNGGKIGIDPALWFRVITAKIDALRAVEDMSADLIRSSAMERAASAYNRLLWQSAISIVVLIVTLSMGFLIARGITRPLLTLKDAIVDIQERNDLTQRLAISSKDEIGQAADALNRFLESLQRSLEQVAHGSSTVLALSSEVAAAASQVSSSSQAQSDAASSMAASVEEMTVSIDQISENAHNARLVSDSSNAFSDSGSEVILKVVDDMKNIASNVKESSVIIRELGQQSNQIHVIALSIKEIADQTNLLALNAAIEAARAGEQGRGFAVVADEVRKLAERTTRSTVEISEMIDRIQSGAQQAVASMEVGVERVNHGVSLANQAGDAIEKIRGGSRQASAVISDISSAIREQSVASNEIAKNVEQVAQMSDENAAAIQSSSHVAADLQRLANDLKATVEKFRI